MDQPKILIDGHLPVTRCFRFEGLPEPEAVMLATNPTVKRDEAQALYAHRRCLTERLHPDVPLHPDLEGDESQGWCR